MRRALVLCAILLTGCATTGQTACRPATTSGFTVWPWNWPVEAVLVAGEWIYRQSEAHLACESSMGAGVTRGGEVGQGQRPPQ